MHPDHRGRGCQTRQDAGLRQGHNEAHPALL